MKNGIILSGGNGTRLAPLTHVVNKHLLGVNGKFIIDYPINTLKRMGVENLTVIMGGSHFSQVVDHLKDGSVSGMKCNYVYQGDAAGIAQAINLCQRHVADEEEFAVILGDNIFDQEVIWTEQGLSTHRAQITVKQVPDLHRFGVISCDAEGHIKKIEEKPATLDTNYFHHAITGCYLFTQKFFEYFQSLMPSARGEYEIVDIIRAYHRDGLLYANPYDGFWSDAGTHESVAYVNHYFHQKEHSPKT